MFKKFWKQLWCLHYWQRESMNQFERHFKLFRCVKCGKAHYVEHGKQEPISYVD